MVQFRKLDMDGRKKEKIVPDAPLRFICAEGRRRIFSGIFLGTGMMNLSSGIF